MLHLAGHANNTHSTALPAALQVSEGSLGAAVSVRGYCHLQISAGCMCSRPSQIQAHAFVQCLAVSAAPGHDRLRASGSVALNDSWVNQEALVALSFVATRGHHDPVDDVEEVLQAEKAWRQNILAASAVSCSCSCLCYNAIMLQMQVIQTIAHAKRWNRAAG
jgi:hypothetical protein